MGTITSGVGLISGINSKDIIDQLMQIEERPKTLLQSRKDKLGAQRDAYNGISTDISSLTTAARAFQRPSTFTAATANSTDENVLTATTSAGAAVGSYQLQVARLVTSQQSVTAGFASTDATVKAGTMTIELGGGNLNSETELSDLNGGAGVRRGQFRISDRSGKTSVIDISAAVSLDDVVKKINTSLDVSVKATVQGDKLVLTDTTGSTANNLIVQDLADGHAAEDLGLVGNVAANALTGTSINSLGIGTALSQLNDGLGVRTGTSGPDIVITAADGSKINVTLGTAKTVGDVITAINAAAGTKVTAGLGADGHSLKLTSGGGGTALSVADGAGSKAATDLGLAKTGTAAELDGNQVLSGIDTVMLKSLKGGAGLTLGSISITDRSGQQKNVDLSGAKTVADIIDTINSTGGLKVKAGLNAAGNGLQIQDASGGTGNLVIGEVAGGTTAATLGLVGTFDASTPVARGANLQLRWVNENTQLSSFNGGKGVTPGSFKITNSKGGQVTVNLTDGLTKTIGQLIDKINTSNAGVTASINANGDGLLLTDSSGGAGKMRIENVVGTTAKDLNILGEAATTGAGTINGSFEKTFTFSAADTLTTVQQQLQTAGFGVAANIINDGSSGSPFRLSLTAFNSGKAGRVVIDGGTTGLDAQTLVSAQDAAAFIGGTGSAQPLLVTSNTNSLSNLIPGVNIDLHGVSDGPVTLNIARDPSGVIDQIQKFTDTFNGIVGKIADLTKFDPDTKAAGLLLGDGTIQEVQTDMYLAIQGVVKGAGQFSILSDIGITIGDGAKLSFDSEKFKAAMAKDPVAVQNVFATAASGLTATTPVPSINNGQGVRALNNGKPDFRMALKDGTNVDVKLPAIDSTVTINDILKTINTAGTGKITATINKNGNGLQVVDNTTGTGTFSIASLNGSAAALDLGIQGTFFSGTTTGNPVFTNRALQSGGGFGYLIERQLNMLIDPVDGVITRQSKEIDTQSADFDKRMADIDTLVASKRSRLESQFANMESVLAGLQSQQSALSGLGSVKAA